MNPKSAFGPYWTFSSFVPCKANESAYKASIEVSENPGSKYNPLYIYGKWGLGKTHLLHAIGQKILDRDPKTNILYLSADQFAVQFINHMKKGQREEFRSKFINLDVLLIDSISNIAGKRQIEKEVISIFENLLKTGKQIVIEGVTHPKRSSNFLKRLGRLASSGLIVGIKPPDVETRISIIKTKSKIHGYKLPLDVIKYLAKTCTNPRELEGCVGRVVAFSELRGVPIDISLARELLGDLYS